MTYCDECGYKLDGPMGGHRFGCNFDKTPRVTDAEEAEEENERKKRLAQYRAVYITRLQTGEKEHATEFTFSKTGKKIGAYGETTVEEYAQREVSSLTGGYGQVLRVEKIGDLIMEVR